MPNEFNTIDVSEDIDPNRVDASWEADRRQAQQQRRQQHSSQPVVNPLIATDEAPATGRPQRDMPQPGDTPAPRLPPHRR